MADDGNITPTPPQVKEMDNIANDESGVFYEGLPCNKVEKQEEEIEVDEQKEDAMCPPLPAKMGSMSNINAAGVYSLIFD